MRLYIAGPMTGYRHYNFPLFWEVTQVLRGWGHDVVSPAEKEMDDNHLPDPDKLPIEWGGTNTEVTPADIRYRDLEDMRGCDGIVLLPRWRESWGAKVEAVLAQTLGMELFEISRHDGQYFVTLLPQELVLRVQCMHESAGFSDTGNVGKQLDQFNG